ncbi:hypothetical protein [Microbulbifer sp. 2201CG32-9]|uniref:hypothetical protein n=1 Tax=unclassified Microbulbifer TaxID=2619833 RepID=UPI00345B919F
MKYIINVVIASAMAFFSLGSVADPIQDLSMNAYRAGWYPNFFQGGGPLTCAQTCEAWVGTRAERERSTNVDPDSFEAAVCKITNDDVIIIDPVNDITSHWIYGNQFDDEPRCYAAHRALWVETRSRYMCLCARPINITPGDPIPLG